MVTLTLVALNLAVFVLEVSLGGEVDAFVRRWGLVPNDLRGSEGQGALVTLLTSTFLHAGWLHLLSNLLYLTVFGLPVEHRVGSARFSLLYVVSAVVGSLSYLVAQPTSQTPAVGASGAIAGVIAAATRTRQEYNEYHGKLEEFPNPRSAWPFSGSMRESPSKGRPKSRILMSTPCRAVWSTIGPERMVSPLSTRVMVNPSNQSDHSLSRCPLTVIR